MAKPPPGTNEPEPPRPSAESVDRQMDTRRIRLALGVVLLTLLALLVVPILPYLYTREMREILREYNAPARDIVSEFQRDLVTSRRLFNDYFQTGDPEILGRMIEAVDTASAGAARLERVTGPLGPEVTARSGELASRIPPWRASARDLVGTGPPVAGEISFQQERFEDVLITSVLLDEAITDEGQRLRETVSRAEAVQLWSSLALALIAIVAASIVVWLSNRLQVRAREALESRERITRLMESKARLIRGFGHDVKNPLGAADAYAALLEMGVKGPLTEAQLEVVSPMRRSMQAALQTVNDLVELSRAETGHLDVEYVLIDPARLVREIVEEHAGVASAGGLALDVRIPDTLPRICTDPARLRQIVGNLLSNATKYTREGSITVTVGIVSDAGSTGSGGWFTVEVRDAGPGIPEESRETIFEEYARLGDGRAGTGLGLAISRRIARLLGGDVTLESEVGRGSKFTVRLPVRARPPSPRAD